MSEPATPHKRSRATPTGKTPKQASKRIPLREIVPLGLVRHLSFEVEPDSENSGLGLWSEEEVKALVEFVLLYSTGQR